MITFLYYTFYIIYSPVLCLPYRFVFKSASFRDCSHIWWVVRDHSFCFISWVAFIRQAPFPSLFMDDSRCFFWTTDTQEGQFCLEEHNFTFFSICYLLSDFCFSEIYFLVEIKPNTPIKRYSLLKKLSNLHNFIEFYRYVKLKLIMENLIKYRTENAYEQQSNPINRKSHFLQENIMK